MCGIAGIISFDRKLDVVNSMIQAMVRRGPDDSGLWLSDKANVALGHSRLSIIDLSQSGHQPMQSKSGRFTIVFNGEIYNYNELRKELKQGGVIFNSHSDTEVVLEAWEKWGFDTPLRLRGMFAFAIWDELKQQLHLVRDRMGIKPLLWYKGNLRFVFASNIKAMLASGLIIPYLNHESFFDFLSLGSVFQPRTIIKDIYSLMPGHIMTIDKQLNIQQQIYWDLSPDKKLLKEIKIQNYEEQVLQTRALLEDACKYHMIADVPIGSFLSGGVDSTIITGLMAQLSSYPIKSFSIGFENSKYLKNELTEAKQAADYIGCDHTEFIISGSDIISHFDDFIESIDQPSYDGINTYLVSKIAKEEVKVALSGLGGDELFAGYGHFSWPEQYNTQSNSINNIFLSKVFDTIPISRPFTLKSKLSCSSPLERLSILRRIFFEDEIEKIVASNLKPNNGSKWFIKYVEQLGIKNENTLEEITKYECKNYLLNTLLRDADSLSMGNGLEVRPVLLDHYLVEWALALPSNSKWKNGTPKAILKDAGANLLPNDFFLRRKTGFTLPVMRWLNVELKKRFEDSMNCKDSEQYFTRSFLNYIRTNSSNPRKNKGAWMIFIFLEWAKKNKVVVH